MSDKHWCAGEVIPIRYVSRGKVSFAQPGIVVEDSAERLIVFAPEGMVTQFSDIDFRKGTIGEPHPHVWHTTHNLRIFEPGKGTCISAMFLAKTGNFLCWYIDLIEPFRRTADGVVTWDLSLDIVVAPDFTWKMKDEDHFQWIQDLGWVTPERAKQMLLDKDEMIARIERRDRPFNEDWPNWRPDPSWTIPQLPADWATVPI